MPELNIESVSKFYEQEEKIREFWENNKEFIAETISNIEQKLGDGNTSEVFFLGDNNDLCIKVLKNSYDGTYHIPFAKEMKFLEEMHGIDPQVKTPKPYLIAEYSDEESQVKFILMQRLYADSIKDIFLGKGSFPENFDIEVFRNKMSLFIEKMHEKNIYHRDLHDGNIMLDEQGNPAVIDFGRSGFGFGEENPYSIKHDGQKISFPADEDNLKQVCLDLRNRLLTK